MTIGAETESHREAPVGQEEQAVYYEELVTPHWTGPAGRRRPIMLVHGPQGFGKSHFILHKARELESIGVPYAHIDLASVRFHSSVPEVFAALSSHRENGLARARKYYGRLEFPRLWIALITIRLDLDAEEEPGDEGDIRNRHDRSHSQIAALVDEVWPGSRLGGLGGIGRWGRMLGHIGGVLPPPALAGDHALSVDIAKWIAEVSSVGAGALERAFEWMRGQGQGAHAREQVTDSLYHLWLQARDPDSVDTISRVSNREKVGRFLSGALFTDLQHAPRKVRLQPAPVLLLDNADQGVGPVLLRALAEAPAPYARGTFFGGAGFPEPLTVVAATAETVDGVPFEQFYEDIRQYMRFSPLAPLDRRGIGELFVRARARSRKGSGHVSNEVVDLMGDFTGGHPGTTAQLVDAWVAVRGSSLHGALAHRPVDPKTGLESPVTVEEQMLATALGADPNRLDQRLREALTTCAAARDPDAGLWLNRSGLTEQVDEDRLLAYPLWDRDGAEGTTVLRRLLLSRLARRRTGDPGDWYTVHRRLADHYQSGEAASRDSAEPEIYHRLCADQLTRVAWHLEGWLGAPDIDSEEWIRLLYGVTGAPLRERPALPLLDTWTRMWQEHVTEKTSQETETILKLLVALRILNDPDLSRSGALHSVCHMALSDLAGRTPQGAARIFEAATWHLRQAAKFGGRT
ncbi:hypothetical protein [Nocardiopsis tropica]|uniref:ATP-binding protein n=1 Tax=Nocardiopsis tropica TaxID=109330 RepID=A0ABU7KU36_9ACTN|nr:hypothetical protein [Nocardiopsis umidischolae]MEE2052787.1 hypothetical protein [Nocardiopsis umidischolae]